MGAIVLFYKYVEIEDPELISSWQRVLCKRLGLTGRIILAKEGINATLGGSEQSIEEYIATMEAHPLFGEIDFKVSPGSAAHFPRLKISIKEEIVRLGLNPNEVTVKDGGTHLTPEEFHKKLENRTEDMVLVDVRNGYESTIGTFEGAEIPDTKTFREFPEYIDKNEDRFKDKEVLMVCTGGVRCERASAYLKRKGIAKNVFQLQGGIHRYIEQFPDGFFKGKNFVFDGRVTYGGSEDILAQCKSCGVASDDYTHCVNSLCNYLMILCADCKTKTGSICGTECAEKIRSGEVFVRTKTFKTEVAGEY